MAKACGSKRTILGSAAAAALPFVLMVGALACRPAQDEALRDRNLYTFTGATMGTTYVLKVVSEGISVEDQHRIRDTVDARLQEINGLMSTYDPQSQLSQFNSSTSQEPFPISPLLMDVLTRADRISTESGGAFDVTVGKLVDLWGFGPSDQTPEQPPSDVEIAKALRQVGHDKLHLDPENLTIAKEYPLMYVDLSAIAKGYGVDYAARALEELGFTEYMLEVGGEVRTRGRNPERGLWRIAIEEPVSGQRAVHQVVPLEDMAMATSGDYRNFIEEDGVRLSHTIDPTTGRPITHRLASATVLHEECAMADGYATALMALGPDKGMAMAERLGLAVYLIVHDGENGFVDRKSSAFERYLADHTAE